MVLVIKHYLRKSATFRPNLHKNKKYPRIAPGNSIRCVCVLMFSVFLLRAEALHLTLPRKRTPSSKHFEPSGLA